MKKGKRLIIILVTVLGRIAVCQETIAEDKKAPLLVRMSKEQGADLRLKTLPPKEEAAMLTLCFPQAKSVKDDDGTDEILLSTDWAEEAAVLYIYDRRDFVTRDSKRRLLVIIAEERVVASPSTMGWLAYLKKERLDSGFSLVELIEIEGPTYGFDAHIQLIFLVKNHLPFLYLRMDAGGDTRTVTQKIYQITKQKLIEVFDVVGGHSISTSGAFEDYRIRFQDLDGNGTKEIIVGGRQGTTREWEGEPPRSESIAKRIYRWDGSKFVEITAKSSRRTPPVRRP